MSVTVPDVGEDGLPGTPVLSSPSRTYRRPVLRSLMVYLCIAGTDMDLIEPSTHAVNHQNMLIINTGLHSVLWAIQAYWVMPLSVEGGMQQLYGSDFPKGNLHKGESHVTAQFGHLRQAMLLINIACDNPNPKPYSPWFLCPVFVQRLLTYLAGAVLSS